MQHSGTYYSVFLGGYTSPAPISYNMIMNQTLKGFRDFGPEEMIVRNQLVSKLKNIFEEFGYVEIATPTLEYKEVLTGKYGPEADQLMYLFEDRGGRSVGMRYDLTVPLARYIANNQNTPMPFRRYQIQPVWRADNTQKGRYREFVQCDIDIVGSKGEIADAEILSIFDKALSEIGFKNFEIKVNSREILIDLMKNTGIDESMWMTTIQSIDKLDKKDKSEVIAEIIQKGVSEELTIKLFEQIEKSTPSEALAKIISIAEKLGAKNIVFDPTLSRGLDYYTGLVFEAKVLDANIGSVAGGGRYDNLIKTLGGPDLPAVGGAFGFERIIDAAAEIGSILNTPKKKRVLVSYSAFEISEDLRKSGIYTAVYPNEAKLEKEIKYADTLKFDYFVFKNTDNNNYFVKRLSDGKQTESVKEGVLNELNS